MTWRLTIVKNMKKKTAVRTVALAGAGLFAAATMAWAANSCFFDGARCPVSGGTCKCTDVSKGIRCKCDD